MSSPIFSALPPFAGPNHTRIWEHLEALRLAGAQESANLGTRQAYTPVWSQSDGNALSIGNGTLTGLYTRIGKLVVGGVTLVRGTTTNHGTAFYAFSLPSNSVAYQQVWGAGSAKDYAVGVVGIAAGAVGLVGQNQRVSATWPGGWAAGNTISFFFAYMEA